jgi:hypothetical protein
MSHIKNYFHDQINDREDVEMLDADYRFEEWNKAQQEKRIEEEAERESFFRIFQLTHTYPM